MKSERATGIIASIALLVCAVVAGFGHGVSQRAASPPAEAEGVGEGASAELRAAQVKAAQVKVAEAAAAAEKVVRAALPLAAKPQLPPSPELPPPAAGVGGVERRAPSDPLDRVLPHEQPPQRLAFTRYRLAWLHGNQLSVRRLSDMQEAARIPAPGAQNVIALVGGGFLTLGPDRIQRLSGIDKRAEPFPRAPRLGPTTVLPSTQNAEQFWLYYEGIPQLPLFDLASEPLTDPAAGVGPSLPALGFIELVDFDHRALIAFGDGSVVHTTPQGLARLDAEGRRQALPLSEIAGKVWRLARTVRWDQVWAATPQHLYRIEARPPARIIERIELPPHPLAFASAGRELALLSIESVSDSSAALRVDVYSLRTEGAIHRRVLRIDDYPAGASTEAAAPFLPEIALAPESEVVAAAGFGLHVYNWGTGQQVYPPLPPDSAHQNLAPSPP